MSLAPLLMLAQAASAPPAPPRPPAPPAVRMRPPDDPARPLGPDVTVGVNEVGEEIVILARKLRLVHVHLLRTSHGQPGRCTVLKSSGDAEVDKLTCDAAIACTVKLPARDTPADQMTACTREEQARRVEELAQRRIEEELKN
jgi:hypothetical protein